MPRPLFELWENQGFPNTTFPFSFKLSYSNFEKYNVIFTLHYITPPPRVEIPRILFKSHVGHGFVFDAPRGGC